MNSLYPRLSSPSGGEHPVVLSRRRRELLLILLAGLGSLGAALALSLLVSKPNFLLVFGVLLGGLCIVALITNSRLEVSVMILALYLGLLSGPVKLGSGGREAASVVRDILIISVALGAVLRMSARRERVTLPPLSPWVLGFVAAVLVETFNPRTHGVLKALGGYRQQLEWVPFFFFAYAIMRSKRRFRMLFIVLGVIALANAAVATYQTRMTPAALASWGPGYRNLVYGSQEEGGQPSGLAPRTFKSEGVARVRPPALGADSGFGGGVGVLALPATLALIATVRGRRRWLYVPLTLGAMVAVATSLGRLQVVGGVVAVIAFALLSFSLGRRVTRPLAALLVVIALAVPLGAVFVSATGSGIFSRYTSLGEGSTNNAKTSTIAHLPRQLVAAPFGVGLGTTGPVGGFGGRFSNLVEGHKISAETEYNFLADELGILGLGIWVAFSVSLIVLVVRRLRRVADAELRLGLAAVFASFIAFTIMGFSGPTTISAAFGPFSWFAAGIAAYWLAGHRRSFRAAMPEEVR
jgi:hypothetical protein